MRKVEVGWLLKNGKMVHFGGYSSGKLVGVSEDEANLDEESYQGREGE